MLFTKGTFLKILTNTDYLQSYIGNWKTVNTERKDRLRKLCNIDHMLLKMSIISFWLVNSTLRYDAGTSDHIKTNTAIIHFKCTAATITVNIY